MTLETVRTLARRIMGKPEIADLRSPFLGQIDPISKERIDEMQRDIDAKLGEGIKFTAAGPAGW